MTELSEHAIKSIIDEARHTGQLAVSAYERNADRTGELCVERLSGMMKIAIWALDIESDVFQAVEAECERARAAAEAFHERYMVKLANEDI